MIPESKKAAVTQALQAAFGVSWFDDISELTAGLSSALVYRIVVLGKPYLLRIITRTDAMSHPARQYACMETAAQAGLAPQIRYASIEDRVSITDFVEPKPFPIKQAQEQLPGMIRRLHELPPFQGNVNNYFEVMNGFVRKLKEAKLLPETMASEVFKNYDRVKAVYPSDLQDMVACHNDLKRDNIVFDGERPWFVDWESAFLNDRYLDLAVVANFIVTNDKEEHEYLRLYFGSEPTAYQRARFFLMRQLLHMFYASFLLAVSGEVSPLDVDAHYPGFRQLHDRLWLGEINLSSNAAKQEYAWVHLTQFRHDMYSKQLEDAFTVVSGYCHNVLVTNIWLN